jgi:hypothetical protein
VDCGKVTAVEWESLEGLFLRDMKFESPISWYLVMDHGV